MKDRKPTQLIVFDFDWSLVDQDTDRFLFEVLDPDLRILLQSRKDSMQWTDNVADCLKRLHERGFKQEKIREAFSALPLHPAMKRAIETRASDQSKIDTTILIISNSNSVFIDLVLATHRLDRNLFKDIITNPAKFTSEGLLHLQRRIAPDNPRQHACEFGCSPNMCKGEELKAFLEKNGGRSAFDRIAYVGDGSNDFCPITQLEDTDYALIRKNMELSKRVATEEGKHLRCQKVYWDSAWEVEQIFLKTLSS
ncbi:hypothetical protein CROQUDRAFT_75352 [Cronartium quercuum f. sp. fusiforme G11]|uniref:Uncharacterized protein n=1 Tax=Cronartium quercuum f. sp. fusiforme G11 TaxID=708437 RepID=A0A9P6TDJ1_9BASI|nr:hypothetical protein CROQUDRAFT_75352 [Cronartium quercuum f. sp. fusiforme G11]